MFRIRRRKIGLIVLLIFSFTLLYYTFNRSRSAETVLASNSETGDDKIQLPIDSKSKDAEHDINDLLHHDDKRLLVENPGKFATDKLTSQSKFNKNYTLEYAASRLGRTGENLERKCSTIPILEEPLPTSEDLPRWQAVGDKSRPQIYVFSAYYVAHSRSILVITIASDYMASYRLPRLYCQYWTNSDTDPVSDPAVSWANASFLVNPENHSRRYAAAFYTCYVPDEKIPDAVSLVTEQCQTPTNFLKVIQSPVIPDFTPDQLRNMPETGTGRAEGKEANDVKNPIESDDKTISKRVVNFTVCVTPLNLNYSDVHQLVEMIETNRMFGAGRFIFYNYSTGADVDQYLQSYISDGIVEVIPWQLPVTVDQWPPTDPPVQPEIHYFGQLAALNDCLYRSYSSTRFIVFTDLDEILVPRKHKSWIDMLDAVNSQWAEQNSKQPGAKLPGAYIVRNTFFRNDWGNDTKMASDKLVEKLQLKTLLTTVRESEIQQWYSRSKYIVWARMIHMVGVHNVIRFIDDSKVEPLLVQTNDALIHHYRPTMWPDDPVNPKARTSDRRMHAFQDDIISRTLVRHRKVDRLRHFRP